MTWLTDHCWILGLAGQNWMLIAGGGLLIYGVGVLYAERRRMRRSLVRPVADRQH